MAETIRYLSARGIPVMSHIGMTPQAINTIGSFSPRGRLRSEWAAFEEDA
jgi:3-methyl-2-oxobutanoate hydroxymethyltransferase